MGGVHSQPIHTGHDAGCSSSIDPQDRNLAIADIQKVLNSNFRNGTSCCPKENVPPECLLNSSENTRENVLPGLWNSGETAEPAKDVVKEL